MRYQIVCTVFNENRTIDKLGYIDEDGNKNQAKNIISKERINQLIKKGNYFFFTDENGQEVGIISVENNHVRTKPDGTKKNNLLHLRNCRLN